MPGLRQAEIFDQPENTKDYHSRELSNLGIALFFFNRCAEAIVLHEKAFRISQAFRQSLFF